VSARQSATEGSLGARASSWRVLLNGHRVGQDDEPAPDCLLGRPQHRKSSCECIALTGVGIVNDQAHRSTSHPRASREDAPLVVASVVVVEHDASGLVSDHGRDLVLEEDRQPQRIGIKRPRLAQVRDEQDQALQVFGLLGANLVGQGGRCLTRHWPARVREHPENPQKTLDLLVAHPYHFLTFTSWGAGTT
jgi:hypothetical protein